MINEERRAIVIQALREYVKANPADEDAFQYFLELSRQEPAVICTTPEDFSKELRRKLASDRQKLIELRRKEMVNCIARLEAISEEIKFLKKGDDLLS